MPYSSNNHTTEKNTMLLNGSGQVTAVPDIAVLRLGVQTDGDNLEIIQGENARLTQSILESIRQLGITDIKTYQYSISKIYDYENGKQIDKGYTVRNILEIRMDELDLVGSVIDTAVSNGANVVDFIDFEVSDTNYYYNEALNLAVLNAFAKAKSIADTLGIIINPIPRMISENSSSPIPYRTTMMREGAISTPIEAGNKQIEASVTAQFEYS